MERDLKLKVGCKYKLMSFLNKGWEQKRQRFRLHNERPGSNKKIKIKKNRPEVTAEKKNLKMAEM